MDEGEDGDNELFTEVPGGTASTDLVLTSCGVTRVSAKCWGDTGVEFHPWVR